MYTQIYSLKLQKHRCMSKQVSEGMCVGTQWDQEFLISYIKTYDLKL